MIKVYDHLNSPVWSKIYREAFGRTKRTNGVYTYSQEIVKHHIPVIKKILGEDIDALIITAGYTYDLKPKDLDGVKLVVLYLHERPERDIERIIKIRNNYSIPHIFITGRYKLKERLDKDNIPCIWLPMSIDGKYVKSFNKGVKRDFNRIIFFGNPYFGKKDTFLPLKSYFNSVGWLVDSISNNYYTTDDKVTHLKISRQQIFDIISRYRYGIGNGRCALEMYALGLKVMLSASHFGGIITNDEEYEKQSKLNFASTGEYTYSNDYKQCFYNIEKSIVKFTDVSEVLVKLEKELTDIVSNMEI